MTLINGSKIQHLRTKKEGTVKGIEVVKTGNLRLRYVKVWWDNESEVDPNHYLVRNVKEVKTAESIQEKKEVLVETNRTAVYGKRQLNCERDMLRYLNPGIPDKEIDDALEESLDLESIKAVVSHPEVLLKRHKDRSSRGEKLKPGQSSICVQSQPIDPVQEHEVNDESDIDSDGEADRSKRRINQDAVNYQVSRNCCIMWLLLQLYFITEKLGSRHELPHLWRLFT